MRKDAGRPRRSAPFHTKWCATCKQFKSYDAFGVDRARWNGLTIQCKSCKNAANRVYSAKYRLEHLEQCRAQGRCYYQKRKKWYVDYYHKNKEKIDEYRNKYRRENRVHKDKSNETQKRRRKNPQIHIGSSISNSIYKSIRRAKNGYPWESLVGYTLDDLRKHLEARFQPGMTWDNYGQWHIDHIIPVSLWCFEGPDDFEFKQCWALCNLQPLWAEENMKKNNRVAA